jgi:Na+-transporting methylmalonyl-CoA/oxaloacetate decarboxylase gamma subunit
MNKSPASSVLFLLLFLLSFTACSERVENPRWVINEVLVNNAENFVDDYGQRSGWIEIFNNTAKTQDIGGYFLTNDKSNPRKYSIPRGDVLTRIAPHQHILFWANNKPYQGTFHISFELNPDEDNYIALFDESGTKLIDEVIIPGKQLADVSWGYAMDGVKYDKAGTLQLTRLKKVTPSTNNYTLDKNEKVERFKQQDKFGASMTITSMLVVFCALLVLYIVFRFVGKSSARLNEKRRGKSTTVETTAGKPSTQDISGEVLSAIFMALHEEQNDVHDFEHTILTINKISKNYSPWSSKIYGLRELPRR